MMMIRSQDRKRFVPIGGLSVSEYGTKGFCIENTIGDFSPLIGHYDTEARCLEILDEIQKMVSQYLNVVNGLGVTNFAFDYPKVYEMPEK